MTVYLKRWEEIDKFYRAFMTKYYYNEHGFSIEFSARPHQVQIHYDTPYEAVPDKKYTDDFQIIELGHQNFNKCRFWTEEEYLKIKHNIDFNQTVDDVFNNE